MRHDLRSVHFEFLLRIFSRPISVLPTSFSADEKLRINPGLAVSRWKGWITRFPVITLPESLNIRVCTALIVSLFL
jgi:hypothetical protein